VGHARSPGARARRTSHFPGGTPSPYTFSGFCYIFSVGCDVTGTKFALSPGLAKL
jgi:hypothetical protein